jgi:hypothetical protein
MAAGYWLGTSGAARIGVCLMAPHPLSAQCSATSKRSGERCRRRVIAAAVCIMHGGKAGQVAARRASRLVAYEASLAATTTPRDPGEALLDAAQTADAICRQLRSQLTADGRLDPSTLDALGSWLDRVGRLCSVVIGARVDERLARVEEARAELIVTAVLAGLDSIGVEPDKQDIAIRMLLAKLRREAGDRPALTVVAGEPDE